MKRVLVFMLLAVLIISCNSKKILSVRKMAHNGIINNIAAQYNFSQKQYSTLNNSKNTSVKNLPEVEGSIPTVKSNQDFLASKDKIDPSVLTTNYSHKELPKIIKNKIIIKSFNDKTQIFENEKIINKKFKINDKTKKILKIIGASILIGFTGFFSLITIIYMLFEGLTATSVLLLLITTLLVFLSSFFVKKITKGNSKDKKDKTLPNLSQVLLLTLTTLSCVFTGLVLGAYGLFFYGNVFENLLTPLGSISLLISTLLIYRSYLSVKKSIERKSKENNKDEVKKSID